MRYELLLPDARRRRRGARGRAAGRGAGALRAARHAGSSSMPRWRGCSGAACRPRRCCAPTPPWRWAAPSTASRPTTPMRARMLRELSGRTHRVLTAVAVQAGRKRRAALSDSRVTFAAHDAARRSARYVASGEPHGKAGAYAVQGRAAAYIARIARLLYRHHGPAAVRDRAAAAGVRHPARRPSRWPAVRSSSASGTRPITFPRRVERGPQRELEVRACRRAGSPRGSVRTVWPAPRRVHGRADELRHARRAR